MVVEVVLVVEVVEVVRVVEVVEVFQNTSAGPTIGYLRFFTQGIPQDAPGVLDTGFWYWILRTPAESVPPSLGRMTKLV